MSEERRTTINGIRPSWAILIWMLCFMSGRETGKRYDLEARITALEQKTIATATTSPEHISTTSPASAPRAEPPR